MSSSSTGGTEGHGNRMTGMSSSSTNSLTKEEWRVFAECRRESFWRRCVPYAAITAGTTGILITKGILSPSPRFGALPKVGLAAFFGYVVGKLSYLKECKEKFKKLENSPIGEVVRQRAGLPARYGAKSEIGDADSPSFETMFQPAEAPSQRSHNTESFMQMGKSNDDSVPPDSYVDETEPKKAPIRYEDLRLKNRENYEVMLSQKTDTLPKPSPEKQKIRRDKGVKNIYGDTWDE